MAKGCAKKLPYLKSIYRTSNSPIEILAMAFAIYGTFKAVTILQEMDETVCEAGACGRARHCIYQEGKCLCSVSLGWIRHFLLWEVFLLIGTETTLTSMGSVLANRPGCYIYLAGKCPS